MKKLILIFLLFSRFYAFSQIDSSSLIKYSPDFQMKEGLYLGFEQAKNNKPIPKARILVKADYNDLDFFQKVFESEVIIYFDNLGVKKEVKAKSLWGFSANNAIFINYNGEFNRIPVVGSICHFVANKTVYQDRPIRMYDNYDYNNYNNTYRTQNATTELYQYLLNFASGEIFEFNQNTVEAVLTSDPALYDEYAQLSSKKQKQLKFFYVRKFNEKHPLYFPIN